MDCSVATACLGVLFCMGLPVSSGRKCQRCQEKLLRVDWNLDSLQFVKSAFPVMWGACRLPPSQWFWPRWISICTNESLPEDSFFIYLTAIQWPVRRHQGCSAPATDSGVASLPSGEGGPDQGWKSCGWPQKATGHCLRCDCAFFSLIFPFPV